MGDAGRRLAMEVRLWRSGDDGDRNVTAPCARRVRGAPSVPGKDAIALGTPIKDWVVHELKVKRL